MFSGNDKKLSGLVLAALLTAGLLAACGDTPTNTSSATKAATTAVATTAASTNADNSKQVAALRQLEPNLTQTIDALKAGDVEKAKTAFKGFDSGWYNVEEPVRLASRDLYREVEDTVAKVGRGLLRSDKPEVSEVLPLVQTLQQKYADAIQKVATAKPAVGQKLAPIAGKDVETATIKVSEYLKSKSDNLVKTTEAFAAAVKTRDVEKAKAAYQTARFDYESVEFLAEAFSEFDVAIDARADDFAAGENDAKWTGFHPLEKAIFKDGKLDERTDKLADQLVKDVTDLSAEIKKLDIDPAVAISGAAELIEEIQAGKITGEEERYSRTDLNDFKANFQSAKFVYEAYSPFVRQRNSTLDDDLKSRFDVVEKSIAPYFNAQGALTMDYSKVEEPTRKDLAQKVEALADTFSRVSGTLGLKV